MNVLKYCVLRNRLTGTLNWYVYVWLISVS